jgi:hypothetical protein
LIIRGYEEPVLTGNRRMQEAHELRTVVAEIVPAFFRILELRHVLDAVGIVGKSSVVCEIKDADAGNISELVVTNASGGRKAVRYEVSKDGRHDERYKCRACTHIAPVEPVGFMYMPTDPAFAQHTNGAGFGSLPVLEVWSLNSGRPSGISLKGIDYE